MGDDNGHKALTADDILGLQDLEIVPVLVPEWGGKVYVRVLPADEGLALNDTMQALSKADQKEALFLLLGATVVNANGERLFSTPEQVQKLRTRSTKVLLRLQQVALRHQGWGDEGAEKNA